LNKENSKSYTIREKIPQHDCEDDVLVRQYCTGDSKYLNLMIVPNSSNNTTDTRLKIHQTKEFETEVVYYETTNDKRTHKVKYNEATLLRDLVETSKKQFMIEGAELNIYLLFNDKEPLKIDNLDIEMLLLLKGFSGIAIDLAIYEESVVLASYFEKLRKQAEIVTHGPQDDSNFKSLIVKFADREKIVHFNPEFTLQELKKSILLEMFKDKRKVLDCWDQFGDDWVANNVQLKKAKQILFSLQDSFKNMEELGLGDGDRLEVVIRVSLENEIEIKFIEVMAQDSSYDDKDNLPVFNWLNSYTVMLDQDTSLKAW